MSISNLQDDCLIEILTKCYDPQAIAPLNKHIHRVVNSIEFATSLIHSLFEGLDREEHAFVYSLLTKDPALERVKEIFLKTASVHRSCWQSERSAEECDPIHPRLPLLSAKRLKAMLFDIKIYDEAKCINALSPPPEAFDSEEESNWFQQADLSEKRVFIATILNRSVERSIERGEMGPEGISHWGCPDEKIRFLPSFFLEIFPNILRLDLYNNQLTSLPETVTILTNLQELLLHRNQLAGLPDSISALTNLRELNLGSNQLTSLPETVTTLTKLQKILLENNQLTNFPESISTLTNLQELFLFCNQLPTLPDSISALSSLQWLSLGGNQLTSLPESISALSSLQWLTLDYNELSTLPDSISALTNLQELHLKSTQLTSLPESISALTNLQRLYLGSNQLTSLPGSIIALTNLLQLALGGNRLTSLPESISALSSLQWLILDYNQLTSLPESISALSSLQWLVLEGNQLTSLPESISALSSLQRLALDHNQLTSLPESISSLTNLSYLFFNNNPLISLPRFILEMDIDLTRFYSSDHYPITRALHFYRRSLSENSQEQVHFWNWHLAGNPETSDPDWGSTHLLDDLERFQEALKAQLSIILDSLPHETKDQIYAGIYGISSQRLDRPADLDDPDPNWGYNHRFDDLAILADSIRMILNQERI